MRSIKGLAYRQKLTAGGTGVSIITPDDRAVYTINKRDGSCVPYGTVNSEVFTESIINEALELTNGMSYKRLGKIAKVYADNHCDETPIEQETEDGKAEIDVIASVDYREFIAQYTDKNDKFSYQLMNKDLIQFSTRSSVVRKMLEEKTDADEIIRYIVKSRAADLARNKGMGDEMLTAFIETLDSMDTRSAFKELKSHLRDKKSRKRA